MTCHSPWGVKNSWGNTPAGCWHRQRREGSQEACWGGASQFARSHPCTQPPRLPRRLSDGESVCQGRRHERRSFDPRVRKIPWSRKWQLTPVFLLANFHAQRSLVGYSPGVAGSDATERAHICSPWTWALLFHSPSAPSLAHCLHASIADILS